MKTEIIIVVSMASALSLSPLAYSQTTSDNDASTYSLSPHDIRDESGEERDYYIARQLLKEPIAEILPASQDTSGNWGIPTDQFQASLRFRRAEFVRGEPVAALAILRNLSSTTQNVFFTKSPASYLGFQFSVTSKSQGLLPIRSEETKRFQVDTNSSSYTDTTASLSPFGVLPLQLPPKSQTLIAINLDRFFDLNQPGDYTVTVRFPIARARDQKPANEAMSGKVSFRVVEKLSTSGMEEKNTWESKRDEAWKRFSEAAKRQRSQQ